MQRGGRADRQGVVAAHHRLVTMLARTKLQVCAAADLRVAPCRPAMLFVRVVGAAEGIMPRTVWIVRWRGFEEECADRQDALDRWGQLDARGIQAEVLEVAGWGRERRVTLVDTRRFAGSSGEIRASHREPRQPKGGG